MSRYIDADALKIPNTHVDAFENCRNCKLLDEYQVREIINSAPSIDIVRCKECKYYDKFPTWSACTYWSGDPYEQASVNDDDYCSYGEKKGEW